MSGEGGEDQVRVDAPLPFSRPPLAPGALARLPIGSIRARGWLGEQLRLAADGLTGHLGEIWPEVGPASGWLGGDGESWERGPYYLRGLIQLAHVLGDRRLVGLTRPWIEWTLASQRADGTFGPAASDDWWPRMPMLEALRTHHEATGDARVPAFLARYLRHQLEALPARPLRDWARPRGGDNLDSVIWLWNRSGDLRLIELAELLHAQTSDWVAELGGDGPPSDAFEFAHGVNRAMGFKEPALHFLRARDPRLCEALRRGWLRTMEHHGQIHGLYSCDEFLHGRGSTQGAELCAIVELLSSFHTALRTTGELWIADAAERIYLNALPATISPDFRGHQYFQQPNQVACAPGGHGFGIHHENDLLFGPATGYGCCAANFHLGWPQLVANLWLATPDGGLAALHLLPCSVGARIAEAAVRVDVETDYPFGDEVSLVVRSDAPVAFPLAVRIPAWATRAEVALGDRRVIELVNGQTAFAAPDALGPGGRLAVAPRAESPAGAPAGALVTLARTWRPGERLIVRLPMPVRLSRWERGSIGVERGPLVYALAIEEAWHRVAGEEPWCDFELHPRSPWSYGLLLDERAPEGSFVERAAPLAPQPWARDGASVRLEARGRRIRGWAIDEGGSAGPIPEPPFELESDPEALNLVPYGCARLRISMFPSLR